MKIFDKVKSLFGVADRGIYGFITMDGKFIPGFRFDEVTINLNTHEGLTKSYNTCSTVATILNRNSQALVNGRWWLLDNNGNDISKRYPGLVELMNKPNPLQSWSEFLTQVDIYRQLFGEVFIYAVVPDGYSKEEAVAIWALNPNYVTINSTGKMVLQSNIDDIITQYTYADGKENIILDKDNLLHIRDTNQNVNFSSCNPRGVSRLVPLANSVRNIMQAEEAIFALNKNRGAQGILSNDSSDTVGHVPLTDEEKKEVESKLRQHYGLNLSQSPVIITDKNLKWQQMSFNVKDLMLFEGISNNVKRIAEAYNYPYELLNTENIAYSNKAEAKREHYQSNIIPLSKIYAEKFTSFFGLVGAHFEIDFSEVECLKKSEAEKAQSLNVTNQAMRIPYEQGVISLAEWRLAMGMDEKIYKPESNNDEIRHERENTTEEGEERGNIV